MRFVSKKIGVSGDVPPNRLNWKAYSDSFRGFYASEQLIVIMLGMSKCSSAPRNEINE
jgi:hypothetical protein